MNAFVDTNLLPRFVFDQKKDKETRRYVRLALKKYTIQHNIVSLVECARNFRLADYKLRRLHQLVGQDPAVPDATEWRLAHYLLLDWVKLKRQRDKNAIRKMQMDCLIAAMAINRDTTVITGDKDFSDLRNTYQGQRLQVFHMSF